MQWASFATIRLFTVLSLTVGVLPARIANAQSPRTEAYYLGLRLARSLQSNDVAPFVSAFDTEAFLDRITAGITASDQVRQAFRDSVRGRTHPEQLAASLSKRGNQFQFVGVRRLFSDYQLLCRSSDSADTIVYCALTIAPVASGGYRVVDIFDFTPGEYVSAVVRRSYLLALAQYDKTSVDRMDQAQRDFVNSQNEWNAFVNRCESRAKYALVLQALAKLPASLQTERFVEFNRLRAAMGEDEPTFRGAAEAWRRDYPNDIVLQQFICEYYHQNGPETNALAAFQRLNTLLDGDPYLDLRIADVQEKLGRPEDAKASLWHAVNRDPTDAKAFAELLKRTLAAKNFAETARALSLEETVLQTNVRGAIARDPAYAQFRKSDACQAWLKSPVQKPTAQANAGNTKADPSGLKLQAILFSPRNPSAMINGNTVFVGDTVSGYKVLKVEQQRVTLKSAAGETKVLELAAKP